MSFFLFHVETRLKIHEIQEMQKIFWNKYRFFILSYFYTNFMQLLVVISRVSMFTYSEWQFVMTYISKISLSGQYAYF